MENHLFSIYPRHGPLSDQTSQQQQQQQTETLEEQVIEDYALIQPRINQRLGNSNLSFDETTSLIDGLSTLMSSSFSPETVVSSNDGNIIQSSINSLDRFSHYKSQVYVSINDMLIVKNMAQSLAKHIFSDRNILENYMSDLTNPEMLAVLTSVDDTLIQYQNRTDILVHKIQEGFREAVISHVLIECLLQFSSSVNEELIKHHKYELYLPIFKLTKFSLWNTRNNVETNLVNDILPNCIKDLLLLPFLLNTVNIMNDAYLYNCLVHCVCYDDDISTPFNYIWFDRLSKLKLNKLIYFEVFRKIDPNFRYIPQDDNIDKANRNAFIKNNSLNYFRSQIVKSSLDLDYLFKNDLEKQSFENFIVKNLSYHSVRSMYDLLEIFCFFYDLSILNFVQQNLSRELFLLVIKYFKLKVIEPSTVSNYENLFCTKYLKYLRYKNFFLNNNLLFQPFTSEIIRLERLLGLSGLVPFNSSTKMNEEVMLLYAQFLKEGLNLELTSASYSKDCLRQLVAAGFDDLSVRLIDLFGFYEYIAFR